jgi:hypothetical protein
MVKSSSLLFSVTPTLTLPLAPRPFPMVKKSIVEDDGIADGNGLEVDRDKVVLTECSLVRSVAFCRAAAVAWSWHRILQAPAVPGQLLQNSFASPQKVKCVQCCVTTNFNPTTSWYWRKHSCPRPHLHNLTYTAPSGDQPLGVNTTHDRFPQAC